MSRYKVGNDPYCYPGTNVLRNKFEILDQSILEEAEAQFSSAAIHEIRFQKPPYNFETWKAIHRALFSSLYDWAGQERTVGIRKESTTFCLPERIEPEGRKLFQGLQNESWLIGLASEKFISRIAYYFIELNLLHPFREGNGRSQRLLFEFICMNCGYFPVWSKVTQQEWIAANISGVHVDSKLMEATFSRLLQRI